MKSLTDEACWEHVQARDRSADESFVYAVRSTGIYCRPSCGARLPLRSNVTFHRSPAQAEGAGFRPCLRCHPEDIARAQRYADRVAAACRRLETEEEPPSLRALAGGAGLSPFHFHRLFKRLTGVTPRAYARARRAARTAQALRDAPDVTSAIYEAGYNSAGRFYAEAESRLGMTPTAYRTGGAGESIRFALGLCSLGSVLVAATDKGVCAIELGDDPEALLRRFQERFPRAELKGGDPAFESIMARAVSQVEGRGEGSGLPLDVRGTAFQQKVWEALRSIPAGTTRSYAEVANAVDRPLAVRAVARACASNTIAVLIPCHRVVRTDGTLSGYRWGIERKRALLALEQPGQVLPL